MIFDEIYAQIDGIGGWMGREDCYAIYEHTKDLYSATIVEIGCFMGRSTKTMALSSPTSTITSIDPLISVHPSAGNITPNEVNNRLHESMSGFDSWTHIRDTSSSVGKWWEDSIDLLFIDGDHHEVALLEDIRLFVPHVKPGGIVMFHDYVVSQTDPEEVRYPSGFAVGII